ncbi:hypothetical protein F2Q68_00014791 [Brassica cretica]|uniref:J domain-containing protein n=1 Tax=Brassica cretica TaxID=69181 RepID=A0A8S9HM35_BRACR|nr:hypothetical protein F2Q68_00014791 [Brassica cretica]
MSSYVIEVNSDRFDRYRDGGSGGGNSDSNDMDEAIAWARERSQRPETKQAQEDLIDSRRSEEEEAKSEEVMEMEMKDEEIRIWLTGKETNIRLLLSTLHHVLWSNSIWQAIPLANLRDGSQVKKAYQKARLCLHPDKLQQRGGTSPLQKSVASRVFSILQEAWAVHSTLHLLTHAIPLSPLPFSIPMVLWSNSIWQAIPLANLRDGSQVKKAYQKARLCLHPDKLQQRGGTSPLQKSVASRVFSILQEAWAVYLTNEGLSG